ncbi:MULTISPECIES: phage tail tape measure protein [Clostridium]|uniref:Phage tail tape measure protein, TP901 family n=1 Tax=Clostridium carnis TaxID=1530 RepID=A0ABY6SVF1_9CLOT|nr:phage tail tape measure protein [Clostridium carnis]CAI3560056.1 Phage tail tape measure protein, TP901 family [Clostridium neonatale]CAI3561536.1 Phage tail tape measure protein, TP901 family [Clostridium neonatale]CAI3582359.1 Phage tail tape measure protein, TP901 family [Clostridium neonatale]CAI3622129.1 Phage tail tape measure protein, TP901 family [Clostridium neonatale]CAI3675910.1 Phage tail tape measure protein, TP901 family [Clostridium neonatale]
MAKDMMARIRIGGLIDPSLKESFSEIGNLTKNLKEELAPIGKIAGLGMAGLGAALGFASKSTNEYVKASNQLQASTGATSEEMKGLQNVLKGVYSNNYGESFEDISNSIGLIKQQIGDLSNSDLQTITEDAYALKDTFDIEIGESVRGANQLMKQFGITGDQAYNLLAQGAQKGLNQNGDLADQVAEYAVYFSDLGYSAEDMFNIMASGAEAGVFQIDFLNDAMKELGIRTKDNSDGTKQAFAELGLNADETTRMFANGGEEALKATSMVNKALFSMEDKVKQNQLGVQLYGTKWEDVGISTIEALGNITDEINMNATALNKIKEIKYSSFGDALVGIGRQIEVAFLPLGDVVLPYLNEFANWFKDVGVPKIQEFADILAEKMPSIIEQVKSLLPIFKSMIPIIAGIGAGLGTLKIINIGKNIFDIFSKIAGVFKSIGTAVSLFAGGAGTLGEVMMLIMNPVGWIIAGIATLTAGFVLLYRKCEPFKEMVNSLFSKLANYISTTILPAIQNLGNKLSGLFKAIGGFASWIGEKLAPVFQVIFPMIGSAISLVSSVIGARIEGVIKALGGIIDFLTGVFSGDWTLVLEGLKTTFSGIFDAIFVFARKPFEWILEKIGVIKEGLSSFSFSGFLGKIVGKSETNEMPQFAKGGIATQPSICGEDGPEMVIPLVKSARSMSLLQKAANILGVSNGADSSGFERNKYRNISTREYKSDAENKTSQSEAPTFVFAPHIDGNVTQDAIQKLEETFEKFKEMVEEIQREKESVSFG